MKHFNEINDKISWKEQSDIRYNEKLQAFYEENDPCFSNANVLIYKNFESIGYQAFGDGFDASLK